MKLALFCDGGSRGNPGPAAYGYVVYDITSLPNNSNQMNAGIILEKCGNYLGHTTNNQAEYKGVIAGLTWINSNYPSCDLEIRLDSLLIVNQIKGIYKVKHPDIIPLHKEVMQLLKSLGSYHIEHTYREGNSLADSLVNLALDSHS